MKTNTEIDLGLGVVRAVIKTAQDLILPPYQCASNADVSSVFSFSGGVTKDEINDTAVYSIVSLGKKILRVDAISNRRLDTIVRVSVGAAIFVGATYKVTSVLVRYKNFIRNREKKLFDEIDMSIDKLSNRLVAFSKADTLVQTTHSNLLTSEICELYDKGAFKIECFNPAGIVFLTFTKDNIAQIREVHDNDLTIGEYAEDLMGISKIKEKEKDRGPKVVASWRGVADAGNCKFKQIEPITVSSSEILDLGRSRSNNNSKERYRNNCDGALNLGLVAFLYKKRDGHGFNFLYQVKEKSDWMNWGYRAYFWYCRRVHGIHYMRYSYSRYGMFYTEIFPDLGVHEEAYKHRHRVRLISDKIQMSMTSTRGWHEAVFISRMNETLGGVESTAGMGHKLPSYYISAIYRDVRKMVQSSLCSRESSE